jgi:hypothetical protein
MGVGEGTMGIAGVASVLPDHKIDSASAKTLTGGEPNNGGTSSNGHIPLADN